MYCTKCGEEIPEGMSSCPKCDRKKETHTPWNSEPQIDVGTIHQIPKCTCCGYVGRWKVESVLRPMDWAIGIIGGIVTLGFGLVYLLVVALIRSNKDRRDKICPRCKARNLWTFTY